MNQKITENFQLVNRHSWNITSNVDASSLSRSCAEHDDCEPTPSSVSQWYFALPLLRALRQRRMTAVSVETAPHTYRIPLVASLLFFGVRDSKAPQITSESRPCFCVFLQSCKPHMQHNNTIFLVRINYMCNWSENNDRFWNGKYSHKNGSLFCRNHFGHTIPKKLAIVCFLVCLWIQWLLFREVNIAQK